MSAVVSPETSSDDIVRCERVTKRYDGQTVLHGVSPLLSVGFASAIGFAVRRLATAPHPFLSSYSANSRVNM